MKFYLILALLFTFSLAAPTAVFADPLYDFRLGHFSVTAGYWYGADTLGGDYNPSLAPLVQNGYRTSGSPHINAFAALGHNLAIRYDYARLGGNFIRTTSSGDLTYSSTLNINEVALYYRLATAFEDVPGNIVADVHSLTNLTVPRTEAAVGHNLIALFIGAGNGSGTTVHPDGTANSANSWAPVFGVETALEVTPKLTSLSKISLSTHASYYAELGFSYEILEKFFIVGSLNTMDADANNVFLSKTGIQLSVCWQN
ncbi:MAG: hypothetical protein WCP79_04430 [Bacillota bacterium]